MEKSIPDKSIHKDTDKRFPDSLKTVDGSPAQSRQYAGLDTSYRNDKTLLLLGYTVEITEKTTLDSDYSLG